MSGNEALQSAKGQNSNWFWPDVKTFEGARLAARYGFWVAVAGVAITGLYATIALLRRSPFFNITPLAYFDMILLAVIAWRVYKFSQPWSVIALIFYIFEKAAMAIKFGKPPSVLVVFFVFMYFQGVRGCFGMAELIRISKSKESDISVDTQTKRCPQCAEIIKLAALKCRFCNYEFNPGEVEEAVGRRRAEIKSHATM